MTESKIDFKKTMPAYKAPKGKFEIIEVPTTQYIALDGAGDPNTGEMFTSAIESLYPVAYKLKFASKKQLGRDYTVMPLEGLWWADDYESFTNRRNKDEWKWTLLIMTPEWINNAMFHEAVYETRRKSAPPHIDSVRLETLNEQTVVQTLHVGPFDDEGRVLAELHNMFLPEHGFTPTGKHHEIYLSDSRKTEPAKLKTILRQPVKCK